MPVKGNCSGIQGVGLNSGFPAYYLCGLGQVLSSLNHSGTGSIKVLGRSMQDGALKA